MPWWLVAQLDAAARVEAPRAPEPGDRRVRHRLRRLVAELRDLASWDTHLRRRATLRNLWVHPGVAGRLAADPSVVHSELPSDLGLPTDGRGRFYVDASDADAVLARYGATSVDERAHALGVMVVPRLGGFAWRPFADAATLVDLSVHADARVALAAMNVADDAHARLGGGG